ncbi:MAG TPA: SpoIID/LytB domain-containing protein, partial [Thermoleophilia bacterium]|nr:SpoIID/LytB domain-containing protein [Thermoleophilia bacterium]
SATGTSAAGLPAAPAPPATIRVARRFPANDPSGVIVRVDTVDFRTYCVRVLSHEWAPPSAFSDAALRAGALAVKDYAWYWATHQTKLPDVAAWGADVDDTTNYQVYMDWDYGARYQAAVDDTWGAALTRGGQVFQASYYAGVFSGAATDGAHMTQWGSEYWARQGGTYASILAYYYPGSALTAVAGGAASAGAAAAGSTSWTGPSAPTGQPRLTVIGPVQLSPGPYRRGQTLKAEFTVRNDGARRATWDVITLVARGPHNEPRDIGSATKVRLDPGQYRLFRGTVKLDLAGRWQGWLVVGVDGKLSLLDAGAPFSFVVHRPKAAHPASSKAVSSASVRAH